MQFLDDSAKKETRRKYKRLNNEEKLMRHFFNEITSLKNKLFCLSPRLLTYYFPTSSSVLVFFSAHLCICIPSYLSSGRVLSVSSRRLTSSSDCPARVSVNLLRRSLIHFMFQTHSFSLSSGWPLCLSLARSSNRLIQIFILWPPPSFLLLCFILPGLNQRFPCKYVSVPIWTHTYEYTYLWLTHKHKQVYTCTYIDRNMLALT